MKIAVVGGGPAGLYAALLLAKSDPAHDITVYERNPEGATYGWGVVFSDRTLTSFREADYPTYEAITDSFVEWDAIDIRYRDEVIRCGGQGFSGIARRELLRLLVERARELGVVFEFEREVAGPDELQGSDLLVAADGVRSTLRDAHEEIFATRSVEGASRYIWFGTPRTFDSFTFAFRANKDGFFQAHAYPFDGTMSTFIVECDEASWRRAGLDRADEEESIAYCETLFEEDLGGRELRSNQSKWIRFITLRNRTWSYGKVVLVGDSAHTAHFSIGSGTKLAMEDSIALVNALQTRHDLRDALSEYEIERKPRVERFQEAARQSQIYFENTFRYQHLEPLQFAFHLLARSGRIDYDDLRVRDRHFVAAVDRWFRARHGAELEVAAPPAFAPAQIGPLRLLNRVVRIAPRIYSAREGEPPSDSLEGGAASGAGLVMTDITAVSQEARITPGCAGLYTDEHLEAWTRLVRAARSHTVLALGLTLGHAGPRASTKPRTRYADVALSDHEAWPAVAASAQRYGPGGVGAAEIDRVGMDAVVGDFAAATRMASQVPFDLVEVHMGHGYLLASFLSPLTNERSDGFGGDLQARARFPLQVIDAVRASWPTDRALTVALTATDWVRGGASVDDAVAIASALKERGVDAIRVLAGQTVADYRPRYDPYYLTRYADRIRNEAGIATIATGDITTVDHVNTIVAGGRADLCVLAPKRSTSGSRNRPADG